MAFRRERRELDPEGYIVAVRRVVTVSPEAWWDLVGESNFLRLIGFRAHNWINTVGAVCVATQQCCVPFNPAGAPRTKRCSLVLVQPDVNFHEIYWLAIYTAKMNNWITSQIYLSSSHKKIQQNSPAVGTTHVFADSAINVLLGGTSRTVHPLQMACVSIPIAMHSTVVQ